MFSLETSLLGVALAVDAGIVSFALGLLGPRLHLGALVALLFGFFQFLMLWLGALGGHAFSFSSFGYLFQFIVSLLFIMIGIKVIYESFEEDKKDLKFGLTHLVILAFATSVDALLSGVSIGTLPRPELIAIEVGAITFVICLLCYQASNFLKKIPTRWPMRFAGIVFFYLGGENLIKHYF